MRDSQGNWLIDWVRPALTNLGTVWLGAAAIFLTRAFPTDAPVSEFHLGMLIASAFCCLIGLGLRFLARP